MRRLTALFLSLLVLTALAAPVQASVKWCSTKDPIVRLNGTQVQILVAVPEKYEALVNGAIDFEIQTPASTQRELLLTDEGFNKHGETVTWTDLAYAATDTSVVPTRIIVRIPVDRSGLRQGEKVQVQLTVIEDGRDPVVTYGTTENTTVGLAVKSLK